MSLNSTPSGERIHIGIFGRRNAGKSSLINAITGQELAVVSDTAGTTTDPVSKAMELLPLGPVMITDSPGLDDECMGVNASKMCYEPIIKYGKKAMESNDKKENSYDYEQVVLAIIVSTALASIYLTAEHTVHYRNEQVRSA